MSIGTDSLNRYAVFAYSIVWGRIGEFSVFRGMFHISEGETASSKYMDWQTLDERIWRYSVVADGDVLKKVYTFGDKTERSFKLELKSSTVIED